MPSNGPRPRPFSYQVIVAATLFWAALAVDAQSAPANASTASDAWSVHAQSTYIEQWHYGFPSPYQGPNSFMAATEDKATYSVSLYLGRSLWTGACLYYNPEFFQGYGLSHTLGMGGFPSGEAIKAGFANLHYNTSRIYVQQVMGLGGPTETLGDGENQVTQQVAVDRLVFTIGKFAANDFFDGNAYSHDSRRQFLNWALLESGAWDEPGDVLGFTGGAVVEWNTTNGELHYGIFMEPTEANSAQLDHHIDRAYAQILQYDIRYRTPGGQVGTVRPFVYWNHAYSGLFSVAAVQSNSDITTVRSYRSKEGFGVSWDQTVSATTGVFARLSWNDGRTEDIAYADIDRSAAAGANLSGARWGRPDDTIGVAVAIDGLAASHRQYLANGGIGFTLGDGALDYGQEEIVECYYQIALFGHLFLSPDWQYIEHPGYNRDRGGVSVYAIRAHAEF